MATKQKIIEFLASSFPQSKSTVEEVGERSSKVRRKIGMDDLRPGGTVSGPVLMAVADVALYVALFGAIGIVPLAVTTNLNINFLRKPAPDHDIIGVCKLIKVGRFNRWTHCYLLICSGGIEYVPTACATASWLPSE